MRWSDIQFNPSEKTLRQFAGLILIVFGLLAVVELQFRQRPQLAVVYALVAIIAGPLGLIQPKAMRPVWVAWSVVAFPIGWVVSSVILAALFYGLFAPIGFIFRFVRRDALSLRRVETGSYWRPRPAPRDKRQYFRQS
jgi:Saxitoxin biosynthesis operon protein SxtJ